MAAAKTIVVMRPAVTVYESAVFFIHSSPSLTSFLCSLLNNISGVCSNEFFSVLYFGCTNVSTS
ncbi:hypothetical protein Hanom_Chr11g01062921 [Helianthus anomalus]